MEFVTDLLTNIGPIIDALSKIVAGFALLTAIFKIEDSGFGKIIQFLALNINKAKNDPNA